jgi:DNA-binding transcriptional regulator YdaS (Cro superfamily)
MAKRKVRTGGLAAAVAAAGSLTALAEKLKLTLQAVCQWDDVPPERCLDVERITGVSRHVLRPDIYGPPPKRVRPSGREMSRSAA